MPELINKGYLYIAQPPLYKVKKGSQELYLKNEQALQDYLIKSTINDASLILSDQEQLTALDLEEFIAKVIKFNGLLDHASKKFNRPIAESLAINNLLNNEIFNTERAADLKKALDILNATQISLDKTVWEVLVHENSVEFFRFSRGLKESKILLREQLESFEFGQISKMALAFSNIFKNPLKFVTKNQEFNILTPHQLLNVIMEYGKKGITVQRFKGLGEMNSEQLWETTLDPTTRTLLQVRVTEIDSAEEIFSTLMGDIVEPRRQFIQANALNVVNLDV